MPLLAVNHHYVRETVPPSGIYPITPSELNHKIGALQNGWRVIDQAQLIEAIEAGAQFTESVAMITFDDGLKEQMSAIGSLVKQGLSAVSFVPTMPITDGRVLTVHKLHLLRTRCNDASLSESLKETFGITFSTVDAGAACSQYRYDAPVSAKLKYFLNFVLDECQRDDWIGNIFTEIIGDEAAVAQSLYVSRSDIIQLAKWNALGTHGHTHRPLAQLDADEILHDVETSVGILKDIAGQTIRGISYPYGGPTAVSANVAKVAAECGIVYGFTMKRGVNDTLNAPLMLSRIDTNDLEAYLSPSIEKLKH